MSGVEQTDWSATQSALEGPMPETAGHGSSSYDSNAVFGFFLVFGTIVVVALVGILWLTGAG